MILAQQDFFERTADRVPSRVAVDDHGEQTTYGQLEAYANRIAHLLLQIGGGPNQRVCIFTAKDVKMYAGVLGALKAGCCWVPFNPAFPRERLRLLCASLRPCAVLTETALLPDLLAVRTEMAADFPIIVLDGDASHIPNAIGSDTVASQPSDRPARTNFSPEDLAYIIFTSGSTGTPKGVMALHRNTTQFLSLCHEFFNIEEGLRFAHFSDLTFDPSVFDMFHCWATGGTLVPFNRRKYRINPALFLREQKVNVLFTVPSVISNIRDAGLLNASHIGDVRHLLLTGEAIPAALVRDWYAAQPDSTVYNMYGTTETLIVSHWYVFPRGDELTDPVPVGRPLPGTRVTLYDNNQRVGTGEVGESVVCGSQLSPGYWDNAFLTEAAFVPVPDAPELPQRAYRTGDLLRQDENGLYFYIGRCDSQVKVRGHRIELGEVESVLLQHTDVKETVASVCGSGYEAQIVCLIVPFKGSHVAGITEFASARLPAYAVPSAIICVKELPYNANGKIDRQATAILANDLFQQKKGGK